MNEAIKRLLAEKNELATQMRTMHEGASTEERGFTSDENETWATMTARVNEIDAEVQRLRDLDEIDTGIEDIQNALPGENRSGDDGRGESRSDPTPPNGEPSVTDRYDEAFSSLLRSVESGVSGLDPAQAQLLRGRGLTADQMREMRAQGVATGGAGGYTVPEGFGDRIIESMLAFGGIANIAEILTTSEGNDVPFPANDDTGNVGALLAENTQNSEQDTTFTAVTLGAYMFTSKTVRVSYQLLQDSAFDMNAYLGRKLGERIGRAEAAYFATGTGSSQPQGAVTGAGTGVTAAADEALVFNDLVNLEHSVDPAYRAMGSHFAFNDNTLKVLQQAVDGQSRPLWLPGVANAMPASIYGYPYQIDQGIADIGDSLVSVLFGNFKEFYIRRVREITLLRLVERYADYFQVGFIAFARSDSRMMDSGAVKKLTHPAT
mgnify:CR=1 FL=1